MIDTSAIRQRYEAVAPHLDERGLRLFAASEARAAGRGGVAAVSAGDRDCAQHDRSRPARPAAPASAWPSGRVRRSGGGRKAAVVEQPGLLEALDELVQSAIRGDPEAALLWVSKSQRHLARALAERGFTAGQKLVGRLLKRLGFSLQANARPAKAASHPDRNAQFEHINAQCRPLPGGRPAGDLGRHQEEGACRRLQERRP